MKHIDAFVLERLNFTSESISLNERLKLNSDSKISIKPYLLKDEIHDIAIKLGWLIASNSEENEYIINHLTMSERKIMSKLRDLFIDLNNDKNVETYKISEIPIKNINVLIKIFDLIKAYRIDNNSKFANVFEEIKDKFTQYINIK